MEQIRSTQADMQKWDRTIPAAPRRTQNVGSWQPNGRPAKVRPPIQRPDIDAWMDRVRVQLDPSPPMKPELEWAMVAGIASGVLLLVVGSFYWFSGSSSNKDESALVASRGSAMNAADPAAVRASIPPQAEAPASELQIRQPKVARVTEEAPTLPVELDSGPAPRAAVDTEARATTAALTEEKPAPTNATASRIVDTNSAPRRTETPKPEEPKTARREPTPVSARPASDKPAETKLALAEPVAAPIQNAVVAPMPTSAPAPVIAMPKLKSMKAPNYPVSAMRAGHTGTTTLELLVLENGTVGEATVLTSSGYPKLDEAAIAVAKRSWKFFPATEDGKPMPMKIEAPVRFSLD